MILKGGAAGLYSILRFQVLLTVAIWSSLRLVLAVFQLIELAFQTSVLLVIITVALGWTEGRRRRERIFLQNLGISSSLLTFTRILTATMAEMLTKMVITAFP